MNKNDLYKSLNAVDDSVLERSEKATYAQLTGSEASNKGKLRHWRKIVAVAAVIAILLCVGIPAGAAGGLDFAYHAMYSVSPYFAQKLKPVQKSCVSNGIQMEVISASIQDDTVEILVAMCDLEQDRIDETTDLFDSYDILNPYDISGTCNLIEYDAQTGTAYFAIQLKHMSEEKFIGSKVTFSVSKFLSHKNRLTGILSQVDLTEVDTAPEVDNAVEIRGKSWDDEPDGLCFLKPSETALYSPADGVELTALGYINGALHVQMYYHNILETDNHGFLFLETPDGTKYEADSMNSFWDKEKCGSYEEYVFCLPLEEVRDCRLYGDITTCSQLTKGDWEITFRLADVHT